MANRRLTPTELAKATKLLAEIRSQLTSLSGGDSDLLFAYRRKVYKELTYDERSKPQARRRLKILKLKLQAGLCASCGRPLPEKYAVLDRLSASAGYTVENTRLVHQECDVQAQAAKQYA